jgi:hypothetical protein
VERLTRRKFIHLGAAASASAVVGGSARALAASPRRKRVVIVGGGLAGLASAHELLKMRVSAEIVILEAQARVGGRVLTVRSHMNQGAVPFAEGQYMEAGAHRIPETHDRSLGYCSELGLGSKVIEFSKALGRGEKGATMYLINDERFLFDEAAGWPAALGLSPTERVTPFFPQDIQYEYKWVTGPKPPKGTNFLGNPAIPLCGRANWPYGDGNRGARRVERLHARGVPCLARRLGGVAAAPVRRRERHRDLLDDRTGMADPERARLGLGHHLLPRRGTGPDPARTRDERRRPRGEAAAQLARRQDRADRDGSDRHRPRRERPSATAIPAARSARSRPTASSSRRRSPSCARRSTSTAPPCRPTSATGSTRSR